MLKKAFTLVELVVVILIMGIIAAVFVSPAQADATADVTHTSTQTVLIGHTHVAFARLVGTSLVINPGSLGMPKDGNPHGSYAVLDGASAQFCRIAYDPEPLIARLKTLNLPAHVVDQLAKTFRTGT